MNLLSRLICALLLLSSPLIARSNERADNSMLTELDFIKQAFKTNYALTELKSRCFGWNVDREINRAKVFVTRNPLLDVKQFQSVLKNFFASTKDYHVTCLFFSTEFSTLPFKIQGVDGKYYFTAIHDPKKEFPFAVGDEIVLFDDRPIAEVIKELKDKEIGSNHLPTDFALAEIYLTNRMGSLGHYVPNGEIQIAGRKKDKKDLIKYSMKWEYYSEKIIQPPIKTKARYLSSPSATKANSKNSYFLKQFVIPQYEILSDLCEEDDDSDLLMGPRKSFLPALGNIIWQSDDDSYFHAYLFEMADGKTGACVRIPSYLPDDIEETLQEFSSLVQLFEQNADILVIDQVNNPGGHLMLVYGLLAMLTDRPLNVPQHRVTLTQEDLFYAHFYIPILEAIETDEEAKEELEEFLPGQNLNLSLVQSLLDFFYFVCDEWSDGRLLTNPCNLYGIGPLLPNPEVKFTKPILVLVDSLDFSGGDFFPAILQDNGRATIFGTRTAGAGGFLSSVSFPNLHGISNFRYTASVAERPDKKLIENQGVVPDIECKITENDLKNNYVDYVSKVKETIENMINR